MIEDGKAEAKPVKRSTTKRMKLKRDVFFKKEEPEKEKVQVVVDNAAAVAKDEVEEGELGTLKSPKKEVEENGEVTPPEKSGSGRRDIEKGEIVCDKAEFYTEKWRERQELKREYKWRGVKDEPVEKGEFIPERWQQYKGDGFKEEYGGYSKSRERERRRYDRDWAPPPPPPLKYSAEDYSPGNRNSKSVANWEFNQERNYSKMNNSKLMDDLGSCYNKHDYSQGKTHFSNNNSNSNSNNNINSNSNNRLKRQGTDPDTSDRKVYDDATDFGSFKSRRLSGEGHYSRHSADKRNSNSLRPAAVPCDNKLSSRHYDSSSSRGGYDRYRRSPSYSEKSPPSRERGRYHDHRERTPVRHERSPGYRGQRYDTRPSPTYSERSPHGRGGRVYDRRDRSPSYLEWSPHDRGKVYDRRERSPSYLERSPQERSRSSNNHSRQGGRKSEQNEKAQDVKLCERNFSDKDLTSSIKEPRSEKNLQNGKVELSLDLNAAAHESQSPGVDGSREEEYEPHLANGVGEELLSMEEDMDICDTPPHVPSLLNLNSNPGKWYYIDHYGEERGPSRLGDLKVLMEEGLLMSDHLVKHSDSDRWVTVENAASPIVSANFSTVFPDSVVQQVSLPVAPGNVHVDFGDAEEAENEVCLEEGSVDLGKEDLNIDERVGALLEGLTVLPGKELEILGEVFQMTFDQSEWDKFGSIQGIVSGCPCSKDPSEVNQDEDIQRHPVVPVNETAESTSTASFDKEYGYFSTEFNEWFSGRWTCKGGDWQRNDEAAQDKLFRRKYVLNDGYPLCQMSKSGYEDPRWQRQDDYYPCQSTKLELPAWAICWSEERNDSSAVNKAGQIKPLVRGVKGTMLPVIRINACVLQDHGSIVSDSRSKQRGKDKYTSRGKHYPLSSDVKRLSEDDALLSKSFKDENAVVNKPQDRVCTVDDLQLHLGDWFYLDGAGHECGPFSCSELHNLVDDGCLKMQSSVVRKIDNVWAPVTSVIKASEGVKLVKDTINLDGEPFDGPSVVSSGSCSSSSFHNVHPQFIGYTLGKLHELVMKSYKSREFAAAINEFLDPWISSRQPKKEMEKHKLLSKGFLLKPVMENECSTLHEDDVHGRKRCRTSTGGVDEEYEISEVLPTCCYSDISFDDLCRNVAFCKEGDGHSEPAVGSWGLLDGHILSRIFHFLTSDVKSLVFAASTCKHWRDSVGFYKNMSIRVDLSTVGANCSDSTVESIMRGYSKEMIKALVLDGCTNISSLVLEEILQSFTCISSVEIKGCNQFEELIIRFPNVTWVKERRTTDESYLRTRSLKQISEQASSVMKSSHESYVDESSGLKDYFERVEKRGANNQSFRQITYKRTKIGDTRKSALVQAREARMRHCAMKKAGCGYRRMEEFLVLSLKDITKENTSNYLVRKVVEIENRVKSGYYSRRGMRAAKQDIMKMFKEAGKKKNRTDGSDMNHLLALLSKLLAYLGESCDTAMDEDDVMRKPRDGTSGSSGNKKHSKIVSERKSASRMNNTFSHNGGSDYVECLSERENGYKLSRMNKKVDSDSESSDEYELSSDEFGSDSRSRSVSDTASDSDVQSESNNTFESKERYYLENEAFDFIPDDREWGARMTKASLVPPVTRKYEVIDQYVIVADEVEVQRKMQVSLPDDYEDKVRAQKNGSEVDMDIPEVKEYKPRKKLGEQVIEQEVYGIDPYTYNLLLDSMSEDVDWPVVEKHKFIEDVVLRELNKQVRHYTGSESTPMTYQLKPVIEEILKIATAEHNTRNVKLCKSLLQAMHSRADNYVSYRKGLGVVCDKEGGFTEDDFVVEFLGEVYPAWKWFEKQDGIRSLQKSSKDVPEFYNIYLERPKGDADGYDILVVDAMHKANYASRICHSCRPNCEAKVTAVGGQYQIGIYSVRPIAFGEEVTFDYNSVTESKEEYEASVCLCGSQVCRGSYLNLTGEGAYDKVLKEWHGLLDKQRLLLEACELNWVSEEDYIDLSRAGLGRCLLGGLPDWLVAYSARLVRFINFERTKLPEKILKHNLEEKKKYNLEISADMERSDAELQAEGVYSQRLQNLALTLDKVRYVLRCVFGDAKKAPPPLQKLSPEEMVSVLWNGEGSLVDELLESMASHVDNRLVQDLKLKIRAHDPSSSANVEKELRKSLLWLRDEVRNLTSSLKCRHDAAADLIHVYAYTKSFLKIKEYKSVTSPPVYISPLDLGPKCPTKLSGVAEYCKTYGENYCLGQLIYWHHQTKADPDRELAKNSRGCLVLPDFGSFYTKHQKPQRKLAYGTNAVRYMLARMEKRPQRRWPTDRIWSFKRVPKVFGSPMLDAVLNNSPLEREMVVWLKNRPAMFQGAWDR